MWDNRPHRSSPDGTRGNRTLSSNTVSSCNNSVKLDNTTGNGSTKASTTKAKGGGKW